jgi:hypothetical protein
MFRSLYKPCFPALILIIFAGYVIFSSPDCYSQNLYKISDKPGGSGGSTTSQSQDTGGNSSTLIIIGAAVIAGFLVYKLVIDKDEPLKKEKKDSTSNQSILFRQINNTNISSTSELRKLEQIPVNFYIGIQRPDVLVPEQKIIMGISCNF